jgi:hypothetical protein
MNGVSRSSRSALKQRLCNVLAFNAFGAREVADRSCDPYDAVEAASAQLFALHDAFEQRRGCFVESAVHSQVAPPKVCVQGVITFTAGVRGR